MAMEPVEFGFEDLDKQDFKVEVEGRASEKEVEVEVPQDKKPEVEIEIVDAGTTCATTIGRDVGLFGR